MEELIFTSSSRGLQVGKSGFCTVAATAGMTPGLIRMLESLSGYRHLFTPGTPEAKKNPVAYSYVKAKVGNDFRYVLSRVKDCGKDYSGRSNKIAHHLSLPSNTQTSSPTRTLLEKKFFVDQWEKPAANLPARELPGKYSKPSPCSYWQKIAGDAGWAGELIESCQMNKVVYLIVKPSTPVMGLIHQAISLLPADQQWQYTFCTFYRQMPPNVDCQIRCVMENSPEIELTRQSSNNVLIDLTKPLGKSLSCWAENARSGTLIEGQRPVVEQLPTAADIDRQRSLRQHLPSAMPDLRSSSQKAPPGLQNREKPEEEELDVLEIEPTPLWKRALVASLVALVLAGITSVVMYPDMYKGLFSGSFFSFNSGPRVSQFASERPQNAPPPKPKLNTKLTDDNNVSVATGDEEPGDAPGSETEQTATDALVEEGGNPTPDQISVSETPTRSRDQRNSDRGNRPAMTPQTNRGRKPRRFQSERPSGQRQPSVRQPTVTVPAMPETQAPPADAIAAVNPNEASPVAEIPAPEPVKQTLVRIASLEAVSFSPKWDLIESSRTPIPVLVATHARQSEMGIKFDLQPTLEHSSTAPTISNLQITPRRWDVTVAQRPAGYFQLVDSSSGTRLEFQCNLDDDGKVDALTDDIDWINRCQIRIEYADQMATVFPLNIKFVRGHIGLDNKRRNNDVKFARVADELNDLLESKSLELLYDVHGFSTADTVRWNSFEETSLQTEKIAGRDGELDAAENEVLETPHTQIDFELDLSKTAFDKFLPDQEARLVDLNARLRLIVYKPLGKPLRYLWHRFIVDAPGYPDVELQSWKFGNHPLSVIRRDYTKRKSALRASGGDSPEPARPGAGQVPEGEEQLIDIVNAEIDFLDEVSKRTAKTLRIDELMPGRAPHPIEIRSDGLLMLMYIDMGDIGKQWSIADMKLAYHGSPIE